MRISTSEIFAEQTAAIDNLVAQQAQYGQELSTGKSLNIPQDDPTQIGQDVALRNDNAVQAQVGTNLTNTSNQLTSVDNTLSSLTNLLQSARSLAIEGASDTNTPSQLQDIATQVGELLTESVGLANTQYAGSYIFGGTAQTGQPPVVANGTAQVVAFSGNNVAQTEKLPNGQTVTTSATLQQAFNFNSPDGSPSVFQVLQNLYNTLQNDISSDVSSVQVNLAGAAITAGTSVALLQGATVAATPLKLDNGGGLSISIASGQDPNGTTIQLLTPPGQTPNNVTIATMVAEINAQTGLTSVSASFNSQTDKLTLTGQGPFTVTDVPTPGIGATTSGNFVETMNLNNQADVVNNLSTQLGDIDNATNALLNTRSSIGSTIQTVTALGAASTARVTADTAAQSGIEDTNVAQTTTQFSLTQTALQAAYSTTAQLEQKDLFDYLGNTG